MRMGHVLSKREASLSSNIPLLPGTLQTLLGARALWLWGEAGVELRDDCNCSYPLPGNLLDFCSLRYVFPSLNIEALLGEGALG